MALPSRVKIVEVSPRDGLQNEKEFVPTDVKVELIDRLAAAGFPNVEAASFVSPKWVPQMADGAEVMTRIARRPGTIYSVLTPNMKGFEGALAARADEIVIFGAASEASRKRTSTVRSPNPSPASSPWPKRRAAGIRVRGSISCALGCPYQGEVAPEAVVDVARRYLAMGVDEIDVADTIGVGTPRRVREVMDAVTRVVDPARVSGHFHDTYGQALANILAALETGISIFHTSVAGLGGCPYAKGATGNVATEDVLYMLRGLDIDTGVDFDAVVDIGQWMAGHLNRKGSSRAGNAIAAKRAA